MKRACVALFSVLILALPACGQPLPRVKGRIVDFDGLSFHLAPQDGGAPFLVRLQAGTRIVMLQKRALSAFKPGAFAGATVTASDGQLRASEIHVYPDALRGSGEGRLSQDDHDVINGTVMSAGDGTLTLFYRGGGEVDGVCKGRARPNEKSCDTTVRIAVPDDASISALVPGDRRLLLPGAVAVVSLASGKDGARSTPGLIVEKP